MKTFRLPQVNTLDFALILSALRSAQADPNNPAFVNAMEEMLPDGCTTPTPEDIDDLCVYLNTRTADDREETTKEQP